MPGIKWGICVAHSAGKFISINELKENEGCKLRETVPLTLQ